MKNIYKKVLVVCCCAMLLLTTFGGMAYAWELEEFPGSEYYSTEEIPYLYDCTWEPLSAVTATKQTAKYFILTTSAGGHEEDLYISLPNEGGVRLQSMHEAQKESGLTEPVKNNAGELEPSGLTTIDYRKDGSNIVLVGTDGTVVKYVPKNGGFELQISNSNERIVNLTNEQISYAYNEKGEVISIAVEMPLIEKEAITGGGERFNDTNQVGRNFSLVNEDSASSDHYSYINVPLFHSNRGYSVWFNMTGVGKADIGYTDPEKYTVCFDQENMDFYLWAGMPLDNLQKYTAITGTSGVSETWTYGFWTGAASAAYVGDKKKNAYANLQDLLEGYKKHYNFYPEAVYGEGDNSNTAQPMAYAKERGVRMLHWHYPDINAATYLPDMDPLPTFGANGKMTSTGWPYAYNALYKEEYGVYTFMHGAGDWNDFSNPSAQTLVTAKFSQLWDWGLSGSMLDFGERIRFEGVFFNGMEGNEMHNFNSYYYGMRHSAAWTERFGNDYVLFLRSGTAGSQYYTGNFFGDQYSNWEGYQDQITAMINLGASGYNLYGGDLGGLTGKPDSNLWNRWVVLSTFSPYMRQHGTTMRYPWSDFDEMAAEAFGHYYYFRKNIVPTVESAAIDANKTSNPIVKGMIAAYPYQMPLADLYHQYLFCDDFLVSTVTKENTWFQQTALPKGSTWYDLYSYEAFPGGRIINAEAPTSTMPVFVKGGAVKAINLPESMKLGEEMHDESVDKYQPLPSLLITPPDAERTSTIYVKDGASTDYRTYKSHTEVYTSKPVDETAFTITNEDGSDREIVLALGVTAAKVSVDGKRLSRLAHMPDYAASEYGYYVDPQGMTTILMSGGWKQLSIVKGDGKYDKVETVSTSAVANALDGDPSTAYQVSSFLSYYLPMEVELKETTQINRIEINWAVGYCSDYDLEYSTNGSSWTSIKSSSGSIGSVDVIEFDTVTAKYVRLKPTKKADDISATPAIYEFEVYKPYKYALEEPEQADNTAVIDGIYVNVKAGEGYQLKAGSLIVTDANGVKYVPQRVNFRKGGDALQYEVIDGGFDSAGATVAAEFYQPTLDTPNIGNVGNSFNSERSGLRFVSRFTREVDGGTEYVVTADGKKYAISDYGMRITSKPGVDANTGLTAEQALSLNAEMAPVGQYVQKLSIVEENKFYDVCNDHIDMAVTLINIDKVQGYDVPEDIQFYARAYVVVTVDGTDTVLYGNAFHASYAEVASVQ